MIARTLVRNKMLEATLELEFSESHCHFSKLSHPNQSILSSPKPRSVVGAHTGRNKSQAKSLKNICAYSILIPVDLGGETPSCELWVQGSYCSKGSSVSPSSGCPTSLAEKNACFEEPWRVVTVGVVAFFTVSSPHFQRFSLVISLLWASFEATNYSLLLRASWQGPESSSLRRYQAKRR